MGQIYRFLGFNTGLIQEGMLTLERRENYNVDLKLYIKNGSCEDSESSLE